MIGKKILSAAQMKKADSETIEKHGLPSLVLMERAALSVAVAIMSRYSESRKIFIACGPGNNGGDGVAIARLLQLKGKQVYCTVLGDANKYSEQLKQEISIAKSYGLTIENSYNIETLNDSDLIVDSIFGIGQNRSLSGEFLNIVNAINASGKKVVAVDIPTGYSTDTGRLLGETGIKADLTVTFAYMKKGLVLADCKAACGEVQVADVGIYTNEADDEYARIIDNSILSKIKARSIDANKGTCGKILIIAGNESIYGACYLSAKAALVSGAGLVSIYTHRNNIESIRQNLPEAMFTAYTDFNKNELHEKIDWADTVLIGPGIGTSSLSESILKTVLDYARCPVVIDADGINLLKNNIAAFKELCTRSQVVITPHLKEMERLTGANVSEIKYDIENVASHFAKENNCGIILKDSTSIVATPKSVAYITSGNQALATPGSGDVLAGLVASLIAQKVNPDKDIAPIAAAYLHGLAGSEASKQIGIRGVLASDIIQCLPKYIR